MEAKDTVMNQEQRNRVTSPYISHDRFSLDQRLLEAQAEISFKAGYEQSVLDNDEWCHDGYEAGRKEVVEWVNGNKFGLRAMDNYVDMGIDSIAWQAKLKEWGIE